MNAPTTDKKPPRAQDTAPAPDTIRVRIKQGRKLAIGRDKDTRMLIVKQGGEWLDVTPEQLHAWRADVETEAEAGTPANATAAATASKSREDQERDWQEYRARDQTSRERQREFNRVRLEGIVPEKAAAKA